MPILDQGFIANRIAKITGLPRDEIHKELDKKIRKPNPASTKQTIVTENQMVASVGIGMGLHQMAEREILEVL
ncbi:MAG: hypothetical protein E4H40_07360, partial [Candidatus Brocadiia bacterium]